MIEDYGRYWIGFTEFDDQGWAYNSDEELTYFTKRLNAELSDPANSQEDFLIVVFAHGWHHNAFDNDCNVQEFRQMLRITSDRMDQANAQGVFKHKRRVVGLYVGWRGESVDAAGLRYLTVIDRRNAAIRVALGSVRQVFAEVHKIQVTAQTEAGRADRMRTVAIGHSFGALVVFNAVSEEMLTDLTEADLQLPDCGPGIGPSRAGSAIEPVWPDQTILINPAFEASRFESISRLVSRRSACHPPERHPNLVVVTAENDQWTGPIFTLGRRISTLFEGYDRTNSTATQSERTANLHAIGFVERYKTHRLCLTRSGDQLKAAAETLPNEQGGPSNANDPVWVVSASPDIVNGHTGFLFARQEGFEPQPYLADWLLNLYVGDTGAYPSDFHCVQKAVQEKR